MTAPDEKCPELAPLLREALAWVIRLHSGAATSDDAEALDLWRHTDPEHEAAFRDAVKLWRTFGEETRRLVAEDSHSPSKIPDPSAARVAFSRRQMIGAGAIAASITAGYLAVRPPLGLWPSLEELSADYRTAKGQQRNVALSDDISLALNTQTSIAVRSIQGEPRLELISGEAAIVSRREANAPLVIAAAAARITARRADFDVRCLDGNVAVSCTDGAVDVAAGGRSVQITAGQQVSHSATDGLGPALPADLAQVRAWQEGLLIVRDWPVSRAVEEVNRYRAGKIIIMDSQLGRRMITGTFHLDHLDDFIWQTQGLFGATVRTLPGGVVLLS